jgi:hypothetical protein
LLTVLHQLRYKNSYLYGSEEIYGPGFFPAEKKAFRFQASTWFMVSIWQLAVEGGGLMTMIIMRKYVCASICWIWSKKYII